MVCHYQEAGCDTAAILVIKDSNDNLVQGNSLRNSGDGVFSAAQEGSTHWGADRNRYLSNDVSQAEHIGIESTFSDQNELINNTIQACDRYGIWLGYSKNALIRGNMTLDNVIAGNTYFGESFPSSVVNIMGFITAAPFISVMVKGGNLPTEAALPRVLTDISLCHFLEMSIQESFHPLSFPIRKLHRLPPRVWDFYWDWIDFF